MILNQCAPRKWRAVTEGIQLCHVGELFYRGTGARFSYYRDQVHGSCRTRRRFTPDPRARRKQEVPVAWTRHDTKLPVLFIPHLIESGIPIQNIRQIKPCPHHLTIGCAVFTEYPLCPIEHMTHLDMPCPIAI